MQHSIHIQLLDNGQKILFIDCPGSTTYYFNTICFAGYNYAERDKYELPHLLEHLAFEGSKKYPKSGQLAYELEKLGGWSNAYTSEQDIRYFLVGSMHDYHKITELALEQYVHPLFRQKNIDEQKNVVEREFKRNIDDDGERVRALAYERMFPDKPAFAKKRIATLKNITKPHIEAYYKRTHTQANTTFVISGALDTSKRKIITQLINQNIAALPMGKKLSSLHSFDSNSFGTVKLLPSKLKGQLYFGLSFCKLNYETDLNYRAACSVASAIYNRGSSSRIFLKSREAGLAYTVTSGIFNGKDYSELYVIEKTDPHLATKLFKLCIDELYDIKNGNFTKEELERAKGYMAGEFDTEYETSRDLANWYGPIFADGEKLYSPQDFGQAIRNVSKQDVINALDKFIKEDNYLLSLVGHDAAKLEASFVKTLKLK
jgi:predicted Zn-dependent peptidase